MSAIKDDLEIELKLIMPKNDLEAVFNILSDKAKEGKIKKKHRPRSYFDTKDLDLLKRVVALRVQYKEGKGFEQTVKAAVEPKNPENIENGILSRKEWKDLIADNEPNLKRVENEEAREVLKGLEGKDLKYLFTASVKRRYFEMEVTLKDGRTGVVELAFDIGEIKLAPPYKMSADVCEVEIEYKSGDEEAISHVKEEIMKMVPNAKVSTISKAETGYGMYKKACSDKKTKKKLKKAEKKVKKLKKELSKKKKKVTKLKSKLT